MTEQTDANGTDPDQRVRGSYDEFEGERAYVIADVSMADAWLSVSAGDEIAVDHHR